MTIEEKRKLLVEQQTKLTAVHSKANAEKRDLTDAEQTDFDKILDESDTLRQEIVKDEARAAKMAGLASYINKPQDLRTSQTANMKDAEGKPADEEKPKHKDLGAWLHSREFAEQNAEVRTMSMGNGGSGGVLVPEQFSTQILSLNPGANIVRARATVLQPGDPPDAKLTIPVFNQSGANGIYGGMTMGWIDEGGTKVDSTPEFDEVELEPKELGGSTIITDKLLRNAGALASWLEMQFGVMVTGKEDYVFLRGTGVGQPTGILGCAGEKVVNRAAANLIDFADVVGMLSALLADSWGKAVWIANQTTLKELVSLTDAAGNSIFIGGDASKGISPTLFGLPLIFTGKTPVLGSKGDLMLADLSYYIIKDGSGPYFASSPHVYFTTNKTVFKMFKLVDGAPWIKSTLLLEDGSTTVSPFVVLK
jgi:HK97 family phage major capsid protein